MATSTKTNTKTKANTTKATTTKVKTSAKPTKTSSKETKAKATTKETKATKTTTPSVGPKPRAKAPRDLSDYVVAYAPVSKATARASELLENGYTTWGSPYISSPNTKEPMWVQVFIKIKEE